jgi:hypothetical protein
VISEWQALQDVPFSTSGAAGAFAAYRDTDDMPLVRLLYGSATNHRPAATIVMQATVAGSHDFDTNRPGRREMLMAAALQVHL